MKIVVRCLLILVALGVAGCGPKRIDGSSEAAYKKSLEAMGKSLSAEEQKTLGESVMIVAMNGTSLLEIGAAPALFEQRARSELNGKTYAEIVTKAKEIEAARAAQEAAEKAKRRKQIETEIAELTGEKAKAIADVEALKKFEVQRSRFYFSDSGYTHEPIIELTVKNGLGAAVSRAYFKGRLASPGRSIPWVADDFNYSIRGGLEPGEVVTWKLSPNMLSDWGRAPRDRADMVFTVELTKLEGADGQTLHESELPEYKQKRLEQLQASLSKGDY